MMRKSIFNAFAVAAGAVLLAALGVSAHSQFSNSFGTGVHSQGTTLHVEKGEVASGAREAEETEAPEVDENQAPPTAEPSESPETQDNDNQGDDNDNQGDDHGGSGGDDGDSGD